MDKARGRAKANTLHGSSARLLSSWSQEMNVTPITSDMNQTHDATPRQGWSKKSILPSPRRQRSFQTINNQPRNRQQQPQIMPEPWTALRQLRPILPPQPDLHDVPHAQRLHWHHDIVTDTPIALITLHVGVSTGVAHPFCVLQKAFPQLPSTNLSPTTIPSPSRIHHPTSHATPEIRHKLPEYCYIEVGRTETMPNVVPSPAFYIRAFTLQLPPVHKDAVKNDRYRLSLYDRRTRSDSLEEQTFVGSVLFSLSDIVDAGTRLYLPLIRVDDRQGRVRSNRKIRKVDSVGATAPVNCDIHPPPPRSASYPCMPFPNDPSHLASGLGDRSWYGKSPRSFRGIVFSTSASTLTNEHSRPISPSNQLRVCLRATIVSNAMFEEGRQVVLRVQVPSARRREFPYSTVVHALEIAREDPCRISALERRAGTTSRRVWLPLYLSESRRETLTDDGFLSFQAITIPEWRLGSTLTRLRIRILAYDSRARCLRAVGIAVTSLAELQEMDPLTDVLPIISAEDEKHCSQFVDSLSCGHLRNDYGKDSEYRFRRDYRAVGEYETLGMQAVGKFVLRYAEPAVFGGIFALQAVYPQSVVEHIYGLDPLKCGVLEKISVSAMSMEGLFEGTQDYCRTHSLLDESRRRTRPSRRHVARVRNVPSRLASPNAVSSSACICGSGGAALAACQGRDLSLLGADDFSQGAVSFGSAGFWAWSRVPTLPVRLSPGFGGPIEMTDGRCSGPVDILLPPSVASFPGTGQSDDALPGPFDQTVCLPSFSLRHEINGSERSMSERYGSGAMGKLTHQSTAILQVQRGSWADRQESAPNLTVVTDGSVGAACGGMGMRSRAGCEARATREKGKTRQETGKRGIMSFTALRHIFQRPVRIFRD